MAGFTGFVKKFLNVDLKTFYNDLTTKKDPNVFVPNGSQIYSGMQGQGKTLSMIYHGLHKIKKRYPKAILVTNLHLRDYEPIRFSEWDQNKKDFDPTAQYVTFETHKDLMQVLKNVRNGELGVIFMIDEIHNYFHSHDSKSMPMWVVQVFSQQRKQRLVVLGTVQDWEDVIKAIRRQIDNLIMCSRFGYLIRQTVIDPRSAENNYGEVEYAVKKKGFFFITDWVRNSYDTYQVINSGREILGGDDLSIGVKLVDRQADLKKRWGR